MEAFALAGYLALFTPSLLGASPMERYIAGRADADGTRRAALDALAQATFYLLRLESRTAEQTFLAKDLACGGSLVLFDNDIPDGAEEAYVRRGSRHCRAAVLSWSDH